MTNTPNSNRTNIVILGDTNAGKSSLLNAITEQDISIVSEIKGTTTDSVKKAMEFLPFGPVLFIDTAGLDDKGKLGKLRIEKAENEIKKSDFGIYVIDGSNFEKEKYQEKINLLRKYNLPHIIVINKEDEIEEEIKENLKKEITNPIFISTKDRESVVKFKEELIKQLETLEEEPSLLKNLVEYGDTILLVVPIDSEAPKGRIILPQVQIIRDALDNGVKIIVCRETELAKTLEENKKIDLIITDSQAFKEVDEVVNDRYPLTGFSIIFARQKGELKKLVEGIENIKNLKDGDEILIAETCTHNTSHEDIGRVKIPKLLEKKTGKKFKFDFKGGKDFPEDLNKYSLIIHCGGCMITRKNMLTRMNFCEERNIPITNYGVVLAYVTGILEKSIESIEKKNI